ncbi:uncharacterized protein CIMG_00536 [Coccidioides immitis RS]|uniref:Carbohydrate-binding domain-containing protein n=3 Tax=Coccidioides immitis TaxID=5501 RepID=J3KH78_COCIM|nr:uncharacterized protein CIMG_00536 [Coccidioides immitis RS]EAS35182.3 hypothetical protein CIMG_00536 [Coccidioides immitis RS]KMP00408.1 hypothetical protein CIRG_00550 [Coccidioides immitis RMSCC 2394]KMU84600.1 hypothetical protein CIHG_02384 [Coccidioides immitis H538.4]
MHLASILTCLLAATVSVSASPGSERTQRRPSLAVPRCPRKATASFDKSVPEMKAFPNTQVDLCWEPTAFQFTFKAFDETNFYFDPKHRTNDDIWKYEVMEAFIYHGTNDPQTYFEFEVSPNNVTYQSFVYNPSKVRKEGAPFDHFFVSDPAADGFTSITTLDRKAQTWVSEVKIPLALFNVDRPRLSRWRMNFFRTVTSPATYPNQELGAWNSPDVASFHVTPFFGDVILV